MLKLRPTQTAPDVQPPARARFIEPHHERYAPVIDATPQHTPSEAQRAVKEVIVAMAGDARRAANDAQQQLDRLGDTLSIYENHLFAVTDDFATRISVLRQMYNDIGTKLVLAQRALYAAPLTPPAPPPDLAEPQIAADPNMG